MFKNYWEYDLATTPPTTTLHMQISDLNTISPSYLGNDTITSTSSPFTALYGAVAQIYVNSDEFHYKTTVGGSLGFQGQSQFQVSLLGRFIQTWSQSCLYEKAGTLFSSCEDEPINADPYFDETLFMTSQTETYMASYAGYNTSGSIFGAEICLRTKDTPFFCSIYNQQFYVADAVYQNDWEYGQQAKAGTIGLGNGSPIWNIVNNPTTKMFDVYMTNFNSWTWAQSDYVPTTTNSVLNFGQFSTDYTTADTHTRIAPATGGSYLFDVETFGFGMTNTTNGTSGSAYYEDINNFDSDPTTYGYLANSSSLALNFRGLGLPTKAFNKFSNLLSVASKGESTCLSHKSGYCALANKCSYYNKMGLWDYDFRLRFQTSEDSNYIRVPLASFAANYDAAGGVCVVFVEYLDDAYANSKSILFGGLFFQSVYAQYTMAGVNAVQVDLFKNKNALDMTYIGNADVPLGESPF